MFLIVRDSNLAMRAPSPIGFSLRSSAPILFCRVRFSAGCARTPCCRASTKLSSPASLMRFAPSRSSGNRGRSTGKAPSSLWTSPPKPTSPMPFVRSERRRSRPIGARERQAPRWKRAPSPSRLLSQWSLQSAVGAGAAAPPPPSSSEPAAGASSSADSMSSTQGAERPAAERASRNPSEMASPCWRKSSCGDTSSSSSPSERQSLRTSAVFPTPREPARSTGDALAASSAPSPPLDAGTPHPLPAGLAVVLAAPAPVAAASTTPCKKSSRRETPEQAPPAAVASAPAHATSRTGVDSPTQPQLSSSSPPAAPPASPPLGATAEAMQQTALREACARRVSGVRRWTRAPWPRQSERHGWMRPPPGGATTPSAARTSVAVGSASGDRQSCASTALT
mmetsp:Transcript_50640/g.164110  ORF Transcript_50640/g.164110 Transcript_50640/m.164110 type:complete len:395 (+) Transcript_50640:109-1293(+)